jgi:uncharacterized Zn finger protein
MPDQIEQVFTENGLNIFPFTLSDIHARCSCPDKANPCKHIGAIYYQLADRFSEDPFILFQLRGRTKEQILLALRHYRSQDQTTEVTRDLPVPTMAKPAPENAINLTQFWTYQEPLDPSLVVIAPASEPHKILELLGAFPLPYEDAQAFKKYLHQAYQNASQNSVASALNHT